MNPKFAFMKLSTKDAPFVKQYVVERVAELNFVILPLGRMARVSLAVAFRRSFG